jgi:endoglucanase
VPGCLLCRRRPYIAILASCLGIAGCVVTVCAGCAPEPPLAVRVAGNQLVDALGQPIRLLGVNRSGAEYACANGLGFFAGPTDTPAIAAMVAWHINAVRIPLNEDCWLGINGMPSRYSGAPYRAAVSRYVARLHRASLYVVLDLHWNAPGHVPATSQQPMADLDHAPAFWSSVARWFKRNPAMIFDLYNEPHGISWPCWRDGCRLPEGWSTAGMQALVDAVRSAGARQPVIAAGLGSGSDLSQWTRFRPNDRADQLIAGFHAYGLGGCATRKCWDAELAPVARAVPVVATEIGESDCKPAFIDQFMNWSDAHAVSYLGWSWNPSGCGSPALIESWRGQPTPYGRGLRAHFLRIR